MADFPFRFETLRRVRRQHRDHCRARLTAAIRDDQLLARHLAELDRRRRELAAQCRESAGPGKLDLHRLIELRRYDQAVAAEQEELEAQRPDLSQEIERRRDALLAADREMRPLDKLDQRRQEQHRRQAKRRELKVLDEIAANQRNGSTENGTI